eukprot:TRINITY_DN3395_c0_g1_i1.p1 TRINITY_DN3395_c0_g1~~TRINITY_DN3395_c0_g1_i1.p1  ORF type:complete len:449 (+),score=112.32 TRINITY_DN3395_c0_g1_i1:1463-2809(+)
MNTLDPNLRWLSRDVDTIRSSVRKKAVTGAMVDNLQNELLRLSRTHDAVQSRLRNHQINNGLAQRQAKEEEATLRMTLQAKTQAHTRQLEEMRGLSVRLDNLTAQMQAEKAKHIPEKQILDRHKTALEDKVSSLLRQINITTKSIAEEQQKSTLLNNMLSRSTEENAKIAAETVTVKDDLEVIVEGRVHTCMELDVLVAKVTDDLVEANNELPTMRAALENIRSEIEAGCNVSEVNLPLLRWLRRSCDLVETAFRSQSAQALEGEAFHDPPSPQPPSGTDADHVGEIAEVAIELDARITKLAHCIPPFAPFLTVADTNIIQTNDLTTLRLDHKGEKLLHEKLQIAVEDAIRKLDGIKMVHETTVQEEELQGFAAIHYHTGLTEDERALFRKLKKSYGPLKVAKEQLQRTKHSLEVENRDLHVSLRAELQARAEMKEELWDIRLARKNR